jgi:RsiW-degrading membrane proteinase PrsW (M82 family)
MLYYFFVQCEFNDKTNSLLVGMFIGGTLILSASEEIKSQRVVVKQTSFFGGEVYRLLKKTRARDGA